MRTVWRAGYWRGYDARWRWDRVREKRTLGFVVQERLRSTPRRPDYAARRRRWPVSRSPRHSNPLFSLARIWRTRADRGKEATRLDGNSTGRAPIGQNPAGRQGYAVP